MVRRPWRRDRRATRERPRAVDRTNPTSRGVSLAALSRRCYRRRRFTEADVRKRGAMNVRVRVAMILILALSAVGVSVVRGQELGGAGTVQGTVTDPTGGVMQA